jgi:hypothetical protein
MRAMISHTTLKRELSLALNEIAILARGPYPACVPWYDVVKGKVEAGTFIARGIAFIYQRYLYITTCIYSLVIADLVQLSRQTDEAMPSSMFMRRK